MKKILLIGLILLVGCAKDGIYYPDPPVLTTQVRNITAHSALFIATVNVQDTIVRGFLISTQNTPTLNSEETDILWSPEGKGDFAHIPILKSNTQYTVCSFAYFRRQADRPGYGPCVTFTIP